MHPAFIIANLKVRGFRPIDIAEELGVSGVAVHNSIYGRPFPSPRVRQRIAEILEREVEEVWPEKGSLQLSAVSGQ